MSNGKKVLGKGLSAILDDDEDLSSGISLPSSASELGVGLSDEEKNFRLLPLDKIDPNPDQPRREFDPEALAELVASIKEHGIIQPILVETRPLNRFSIVAGERRYRAAKQAGLTEIPAVIKNDLTEEKTLELALIENIQRSNLSPIEEALAYKKIMELEVINQEELALRVGKNRATIANSLRLLKLSEDIQTAVNEGSVSLGHAKVLLSVVNPSDQKLLYNTILNENISVREAEKLAQKYNEKKKGQSDFVDKTPSLKVKEVDLIHLQNELMTLLGTKVLIKGSLKKGKIEIDYYSKEDLERLYDLMTQ